MTIVVGYTTRPEGRAALERAIVEAKAHEEDLVVLNVSEGDGVRDPLLASETDLDEVRGLLSHAGVEGKVRQLVRGKDAAEEIDSIATEVDASLVIIGLRKRTPVGKLVLGSNSQRILLTVDAPVLAVKA
ncbi:universal stress protein [Georgenia yuyongxinii]|uniref:Universal stress protein n=1 Tax=Georgenia yuyongxinii TaxID=2589797 RepID=A0A552WKN0_9MICO|nr:universal stress protein [Georgenia yuyongxinii]QDC23743.1 universal stress protein [Georgenia yuyongxinii]TRW43297.1 universal stress protein [Georgenia yuyongxinii]